MNRTAQIVRMGEVGHPEYMGETHLVDIKDGYKWGSGSDVKCSGIQRTWGERTKVVRIKDKGRRQDLEQPVKGRNHTLSKLSLVTMK